MREILSLVMIVSLIIVIFRIPVEAPLKNIVRAMTVLILDSVDVIHVAIRDHVKSESSR